MSDADNDDLRTTVDSIDKDVSRLVEVEDEKRRLALDDPQITALSDEAVEIADRLQKQTVAERQLTNRVRTSERVRRAD